VGRAYTITFWWWDGHKDGILRLDNAEHDAMRDVLAELVATLEHDIRALSYDAHTDIDTPNVTHEVNA